MPQAMQRNYNTYPKFESLVQAKLSFWAVAVKHHPWYMERFLIALSCIHMHVTNINHNWPSCWSDMPWIWIPHHSYIHSLMLQPLTLAEIFPKVQTGMCCQAESAFICWAGSLLPKSTPLTDPPGQWWWLQGLAFPMYNKHPYSMFSLGNWSWFGICYFHRVFGFPHWWQQCQM